METKFNFNSQICTTKEQSERLLALGLKRETADMCRDIDGWTEVQISKGAWTSAKIKEYIPMWSLHRLILLLLDNRCVAYDHISFSIDETDVFTKVINHLEWLIKEEHFPKEYLEE